MKKALRYIIPCTILLFACRALAATPAPIQPTTGAAAPPSADAIMYYYFVPANTPPPQGSVVIAPDIYILAPTQLLAAHGPDPAADLKIALQAALDDRHNLWVADKLEIAGITLDAGHADVLLQGEIYGVGDVTLIAARMQILMTIFANPAVQSASVSFHGDTIGNWGVSNSMDARPANYVFTRAEIESFMAQNAYKAP